MLGSWNSPELSIRRGSLEILQVVTSRIAKLVQLVECLKMEPSEEELREILGEP